MTSRPDDDDVEEVRRVEDLISALEAVEDPTDRFRRAGELLATWSTQQSRISGIRQQVVVSLRAEGVSYRKIAKTLGVSPVRVQQIEKGETSHKRGKARPKSDSVSHGNESSDGRTESR
ncbi:MAG: hypothetical protein JO362_21800 [Streptomycetaceae bacterium]|nr:hypothetical protein [Streptomycetaceae bacterium]